MQDLGDLRQLSTAYPSTLLDKHEEDYVIQGFLDEALDDVVQETRVWARQHEASGRYRDAEFLFRRACSNESISLIGRYGDKDALPALISIYKRTGDYSAAEMTQEKLLTQFFSKISDHTLGERDRAVYAYSIMLSDFRQRVLDISSRLGIPVEKHTDLFIACRIAVLDIPLLNEVSFQQGLIILEPYGNTHCTLLHITAKQNAINLARLLIEKGVKIDSKDTEFCTPLHIAAKNAAPAMVELLLAHNANVQAVDCVNGSPLHASLNGEPNLEIVAMLIYAKVDLDLKDRFGETALMIAIECDLSIVALFLLEHGANVEGFNDSGDTPLLIAVRSRREWAVKILLEKGANLEARNATEETALSVAVEKGQGSIVQILLDHGAMTKITVDQQNAKDETCLCRAVRVASVSIVEMLLHAGADICAKNDVGETVLHRAVLAFKESYENMMHLLLSHSGPLDAINRYGETVFHLAVHYRRPNLISILIRLAEPDRLPIICGMRDYLGRTVLDHAVVYARHTKISSVERSIVHVLESALGLTHSSI